MYTPSYITNLQTTNTAMGVEMVKADTCTSLSITGTQYVTVHTLFQFHQPSNTTNAVKFFSGKVIWLKD